MFEAQRFGVWAGAVCGAGCSAVIALEPGCAGNQQGEHAPARVHCVTSFLQLHNRLHRSPVQFLRTSCWDLLLIVILKTV